MGTIWLDGGERREPKTRFNPAMGTSLPREDVLEIYPGESLSSFARRAYGPNGDTLANQEKIESANGLLSGNLRVPR